jgi:two-component system, OmpR family, sensor histidine kinase MprB
VSFRLRITLFLALAVAVAVVAVSWAAYASARHEAVGEIDEALLSRVGPEGGPGGGTVMVSSGPRPSFTQGFPDTGFEMRPDVVMQFADQSGTVFTPFPTGVTLPVGEVDLAIAAAGGGPLFRDVEVDGVHYRMVTTQAVAVVASSPGQASQASTVALQVARDLTETDAFLGDLRTRLLLIGGSAVLAAGILAWFVSHRAVRPVAVLTQAAEHVAATRDLEVPIEVTRKDEIGRLAASFNTMLAALASSRSQQRRLVADAGHELRTPLTSLRTNIEVLARVEDMPAGDRAELLSDARQELEELSALVAELVDLAADAPPEPQVAVRLDELVTDAADRFRRRTGREVAVRVEPAPLDGRPGRLTRAVTNLLDNAGKFSPPGSAVEVTLRGGRVEVRDHGPGIAAEDLPRIFERFYRAVGARTTPGSGLGLAIVEEVAREHGGRAFAENAVDGGAVVGFEVAATVAEGADEE